MTQANDKPYQDTAQKPIIQPTYQVHIPVNISPQPEKHEITAARLLAEHFNADIHFVVRTIHKTADFKIKNTYWELKSPTGNGKRTIQHALQSALLQSQNIIMDARQSKMHINKFQHEVEWQFAQTKKIKRLILITKTSGIIELKR